MRKKPLVSVVITSYNQKDILPIAIGSVLEQSYENLQIIIADDASTDGSIELLGEYAKEYPQKVKLVLSSKNQGIPKNKNQGFKACDGEFITYLDGDDYFFPEKIEKEIRIFEQYSDLEIVYSNLLFVDPQRNTKKIWKKKGQEVPKGHIFLEVYSRNFPYWTLYRNELIRSNLLKSIDYYDEHLFAFEDWDSRIRMTHIATAGYSDYIGSAYVNDSRSISKTSKTEKLLSEMQYVIDKNKSLLKEIDPKVRRQVLLDLEKEIVKRKIFSVSGYFQKILNLLNYSLQNKDCSLILEVIQQKFSR